GVVTTDRNASGGREPSRGSAPARRASQLTDQRWPPRASSQPRRRTPWGRSRYCGCFNRCALTARRPDPTGPARRSAAVGVWVSGYSAVMPLRQTSEYYRLRPTGRGAVLDVGCGSDKYPGAIGIDISEDTEADVV